MSENKAQGGIGFGGALLLVFITLKLCGTIGWSWWWVLSPLWIAGLIFLVALMVIILLELRD